MELIPLAHFVHQPDLTWCLPSRLDDNPLTWLIMVNGLIADARQMPREIQETAFEKGFIPYIPDDRAKDMIDKELG